MALVIAIERALLFNAAELVGFPVFPELGVRDEATWAAAVFTPAQRPVVLAALAPLLTAVPPGDARLARVGERAPETPAARARRWRDELLFVGDVTMRDVAIETLERLPRPVGEFIAGTVAMIGTGWETAGFTTGPVLEHPDGRPRQRLIVLDGAARDRAALRFTIAHECAHVWGYADAEDAEPPMRAQSTTGRENLERLAIEEDWHARWEVPFVRERLADALALSWLCRNAIERGELL